MRCEDCGVEPYQCASCGDLCCRCPLPWSGGHRQHYRRDGTPYELAEHLRRLSLAEVTRMANAR